MSFFHLMRNKGKINKTMSLTTILVLTHTLRCKMLSCEELNYHLNVNCPINQL